MEVEDVLGRDFSLRYDPKAECLLISKMQDKKKVGVPISIKLSTLKTMDKELACNWLGKTILLLIPETRKDILEVEE